MPITQQELDQKLNRQYTIPVEISQNAPLQTNNRNYDELIHIQSTGFSFKPRELLHAIGCKTASLPYNEEDKCINMALLYTDILDYNAQNLCYVDRNFDSDLQTNRSNEIGIGFLCLFAKRYFDIPFDQLGAIPAPGNRFDYRGTNGNINCIFEAKGTKYRYNQASQISSGIDKKKEHHKRGQYFDVELIISSCVGKCGTIPRIIIGDPDYSNLLEIYKKADDRFFRLRHYSRVFQFIGLPKISYILNIYALNHLRNKRDNKSMDITFDTLKESLKKININGDTFYGKWNSSVYPENSRRYIKYKNYETELNKLQTFQGLREYELKQLFEEKPFSHSLIEIKETEKYDKYEDMDASVLEDGSIQIFKSAV